MYVCICRAVSERTIESAINSGARTIDALQRATGAGTSCGSCLPAISRVLHRAVQGADAPQCASDSSCDGGMLPSVASGPPKPTP